MAKITVKAGSWQLDLGATNNRIVIGRDLDCDMTVNDPSVSRHHAELMLQGEQLWVRDLGSSNGTWVDGAPVGAQPVPLRPNQAVFAGTVPVHIRWAEGAEQGATRFEPNMAALIQQSIDAARAQALSSMSAASAARPAAPVAPMAPMAAPSATAALSAQTAPDPAQFPYRVQGHNNNGVLLIALRKEAYINNDVLEGVVEYTATDNETINSITVELVEVHQRGPKGGHKWDRMIVRQGPWQAAKGDVVLLPFQLRVPAGTSATGREVHWEIRGYADIAWAYDVECTAPIQMRNGDIEFIRDGLGSLDFRVAEMRAEPLGQKYTGSFQPSPTKIKELGITDIHFVVEYLGVNLKLTLKVEKSSLFKFDKTEDLVVEIAQLRAMSREALAGHLQGTIDRLMGRPA
jgi:hypothetical protein